jgi:uncharacterized protein (DUF1697 family)
MPRYVAFLRAVSPMNASMPQLRRAFERAGFTNVKTVLSSGNVVFDARSAAGLERKAEAVSRFLTIVRSVGYLRRLLAADPYGHQPSTAKRVVTFLRRRPTAKLRCRSSWTGRASWPSKAARSSPPTCRVPAARNS